VNKSRYWQYNEERHIGKVESNINQSIQRSPISLGFAVMFRSIIGIALIPIWRAVYLVIVLVEEVGLERALGQLYLDYKQQVKGCIIPGLPI
jgi:hypothetical protein